MILKALWETTCDTCVGRSMDGKNIRDGRVKRMSESNGMLLEVQRNTGKCRSILMNRNDTRKIINC
jgi:hypothetical protein